MTPEKWRDRIFRAIVRYVEAEKRTRLQKRAAYENLVAAIDAVIEACSKPKPPCP